MFQYCEIIKGGAFNRGNVVKLPDGMTNHDLDYYGKPDITDAYHSAFMHTQEYVNYESPKGDRSKYPGAVGGSCLFWDFDSKDTDKSREDTLELVERLIAYSASNIRIYFTGAKGFHVIYVCPEIIPYSGSDNFETITKNVCMELGVGLRTLDTIIYDKTRIIRTPNSKHGKTGLYKIPLTYEELKLSTMDEILTLAKKQRKVEWDIPNEDDGITDLIETSKDRKPEKTSNISGPDLLDGIMYGFESGNRNSGLFSIGAMLRSRNVDDNFIHAFLTAINNNSPSPLSSVEVSTITNSVCRYDTDPQYDKADCSDIVTMDEASQAWEKIITSSGYTSFGERFKHINDRLKMCIPGDAIGVVANSGVGKTTIGMELGNEEAKSRGMYSLFASLEMSRAGVFFRAATIDAVDIRDQENYVSSSVVAKKLLEDQAFKASVVKNWGNLLTIDRGGLSLEQIVEYFRRAQEKYDGRIGNLVIDYAQNIRGAEDITQAMLIAQGCKDWAKELNTKVLLLMQCNKTMPDDYTEVQKNHLEGSGKYYQAMDYILAFWKSVDQKNRLHGKFLKERWGDGSYKYDLVREGLKYHTEEYLPDKSSFGGL